jgi:stage II sporulation protein M
MKCMSVLAIHFPHYRPHYRKYGRKSSFMDLCNDIKQAIIMNKAICLLALLLLAGMTVGAVVSRNAGFRSISRLDFLFAGNFKARLDQPFVTIFSASFASAFLFILACFLCGLSIWGAFLLPAIPFFRGFGLGLTSGFLYATYGWKGFLYNLSVILPGAFLCCIAILLATLEGMRYSRSLALHKVYAPGGKPIRTYITRFAGFLGFACVAAIVDTLMSALFGGFFSF